ncbi:MAG: cytidylate kinase-like family protein [Hungatella hathewayi]|uniref:cytidylate kinase-like family protein n=1 Tax=Hungatella TaxID=1649459 RepID=UPI0011059939|nr:MULTISPECIES: cytidylate kinase-like family protein [Hungatella]MCI7384046.1 cytidylate kinase-like family protein [Hungatella sp.]MDY6237938.1 cytidylate kinase-like family protein [Hungatella hathewayi]
MGDNKLIITIGRQYGSGGNEIGRKLAEELGIDFYDKNILRMNSDESGIKESYFHLTDEKAGSRLLYRIVSGMTPEMREPSFGSDLISADNLFRFQSEVIRKLAEEQSCVIVGRCADYVLEDADDIELVRVFIYADMDARIRRVREKELYAPEDVRKNVKRIDKERRNYYRYYTGRGWADPENYDLLINTSTTGIKGSVRMIEEYIKIRGYKI